MSLQQNFLIKDVLPGYDNSKRSTPVIIPHLQTGLFIRVNQPLVTGGLVSHGESSNDVQTQRRQPEHYRQRARREGLTLERRQEINARRRDGTRNLLRAHRQQDQTQSTLTIGCNVVLFLI